MISNISLLALLQSSEFDLVICYMDRCDNIWYKITVVNLCEINPFTSYLIFFVFEFGQLLIFYAFCCEM